MSGSSICVSVKEVSLNYLGGVPIQYFELDPIDPQSSSDSEFLMHSQLRIQYLWDIQKMKNLCFWDANFYPK